MEYEVKRNQICKAFRHYLSGSPPQFHIDVREAVPRRINDWDDYFRIDLARFPSEDEFRRQLKEESVRQLVELFPVWRADETTFEEGRRAETLSAGRIYFNLFFDVAERIKCGDIMAHIDSPVDSMIVENLLFMTDHVEGPQEKLEIVADYFKSEHFAEVPYEWLSSCIFAVLRQKVKQGQYASPAKARRKLSGFFYDVQFVSAYLPYSDAMFIDSVLWEFLRDPRIDLSSKYKTRLFSRRNWEEFIDFLRNIEATKSEDVARALQLVHPKMQNNDPTSE
jgi:hypothetical protein